MTKHFLVGGAVRDQLLGITPKDYDYCVEGCSCFEDLVDYVKHLGYLSVKDSGTESGFVEFPHTLTLKARNPKTGEVEDFACTRKEFDYRDRRHPAKCEIGTLEEDLGRRDFTINAIAFDPEKGVHIDPFDGKRHLLVDRLLSAVGNPVDRFLENPERVIRGIRFSCQFGLKWERETYEALKNLSVLKALEEEVDDCKVKALNRVLSRKENYLKLFSILHNFPFLQPVIFSNIGLQATNKKGFQ